MTTALQRTAAAQTTRALTDVWIVGASGLLAGEFVRLIEGHPRLRLAGAVSREGGVPLSRWHPHLAANAALLTRTSSEAADDLAARLARDDAPLAVVLGMPHGESARAWNELRAVLGDHAERVLLLDLSADFRLRDAREHERWYPDVPLAAEERARFAYGLPELFRDELAGASRVAVPGCFATALQLSTVPAARAGLLAADRPWTYFAVTGSSGSGATPKSTTHHPHRAANMWAYGLDGHRHEAELAQALALCGLRPPLVFVPHSGPFVRGIHLTAQLPLAPGVEFARVRAAFTAAYADEPFVELLAEGVPDLRRVVGSNRASLALHERAGQLLCLLTLDNVVKGGSGQALQCLNLLLGLDETEGIPRAGLGVIG